MSDGRTHDQFTQTIAIGTPILVSFCYSVALDSRVGIMGILAFLGCQLQRYYSPDTDVNQGFYGLHIAKEHFGIYLGNIWEIIIYPLRAVPHRHWLSHSPIIGSLFRLGYLYFVYFIITLPFPQYFLQITENNAEYFAIFAIGFMAADFGHLFLDYIWSI